METYIQETAILCTHIYSMTWELYTVTSVWLVSRYAASLQEVEAHIHEEARLRNELEDKAGIAERKGRLLKNGSPRRNLFGEG